MAYDLQIDTLQLSFMMVIDWHLLDPVGSGGQTKGGKG